MKISSRTDCMTKRKCSAYRYLKDYDYYDKCYHEREKEDRLLFKRGSNSGGCLCFSRTGSDGMVAGLAWRRLLLMAAISLALTALAGAAIVLLWSRSPPVLVWYFKRLPEQQFNIHFVLLQTSLWPRIRFNSSSLQALSPLPTRFLCFSLLASVHTKHLFQFLKHL